MFLSIGGLAALSAVAMIAGGLGFLLGAFISSSKVIYLSDQLARAEEYLQEQAEAWHDLTKALRNFVKSYDATQSTPQDRLDTTGLRNALAKCEKLASQALKLRAEAGADSSATFKRAQETRQSTADA